MIPNPTPGEIANMVDFWRTVNGWRDRIIILAYESGMPKRAIAHRMNLAVSTVRRVIDNAVP